MTKKLATTSAVVAVHICPLLLLALQNQHQPFTVSTQFSHKQHKKKIISHNNLIS
jgi:hypothetical protein